MHDQRNTHSDCHLLTTAIPYVNAKPHIGFALEIVQADVLARAYRASGAEVYLLAGTDENSIKNVHAAEHEGVPVAGLVARNASFFESLKNQLNLSYDDFIRTSADPRHRPGAERLWAACAARGDLYKKPYRGLYCQGCEQFYKPDDLIDGRCPEHDAPLEVVEEENWFFRLSRYEDELRAIYDRRDIEILPEVRRNEILGWIDRGLEDFSVSRSTSRARGWGIPVPNDAGQVMYVWFDALANYITALGYATGDQDFEKFWSGAGAREHVIGKGIARFHAIYWPAILISAGLSLPTRIFIHGYVTVEGRKVSKSLGNTVEPAPLAAEFGSDALRYYLLRHVRPFGDGDFSRERFEQAYRSELADQLGNLTQRTLTMVVRYCGGTVPAPSGKQWRDEPMAHRALNLCRVVFDRYRRFEFDGALNEIWTVIADANREVSAKEPWRLAKLSAAGDQRATQQLHDCLFLLAVALRAVADSLAPALPDTARNLRVKIGATGRENEQSEGTAGCVVEAGAQLFPKR
ncbi:methionine--tRNA ligase [Pelagibius sp. Alg239-R121]|uniref:methionine--tRNA ligase n=1 Tax=Pelagibius sp. Alg239-R121 TaxID=2993448 RepID=UPI0024A69913|nr:methionine--tRNA ligase [Pelagibius sp. Alg239-R121]